MPCKDSDSAGKNSLPPRKRTPGIRAVFSIPAAHARAAGPEQERVALRTVADSGKPLPLQPIGSACPSTRSGCAVPCGASLHALAWHFARHQAVAKRKQGRILCDGFAQRQGLGWNPSMDSCPDLQTLRLAHRECSNLNFVLKTWHFCGRNGSKPHFVHKTPPFCGRKRRSTCWLSVYKLAKISHRGPITDSPSATCKLFQT